MLANEKILVTGAAGQVAFPVARELARQNKVCGFARFSKGSDRARLEAAGIECIQGDLATDTFARVPDDFTYVLNFAYVTTGDFDYDLAANAEGVARLMYHCRRAKAWFQCSTLGVYAYAGQRALKESDALGDSHRSFLTPTYSIAKIAAEVMVRFGARQWNVPSTIARLGVAYGNNGGWPAFHLEMLLARQPIPVHPDRPNMFSPLHEDDYIGHVPKFLAAAAIPPTVTNWGGSVGVSIEDWCTYMGQLIGVEPRFEYTEMGLASTMADPTRMHQLVGPTTVDWRDGMRRMTQARHPELPLRL